MASLEEDIAEIHRKRDDREETRRRIAARVKVADAATRLQLDVKTLELLCHRRNIRLTFGMLEAADVEGLAIELEAERAAGARVAPPPSQPVAAAPPAVVPVVLQTPVPSAADVEAALAHIEAVQARARAEEIVSNARAIGALR